MSRHRVRHARWVDHVNGVNPPRALRDWLTDQASLTVKLTLRSKRFRVERLCQKRGYCLADEAVNMKLPRRVMVQEREVLLRCDETAVVFAHTIVPLSATAADWPFFGRLGNRSLGTTLFGDPKVVRGAMQYARLHPDHPLVRRAAAALDFSGAGPMFARRCLYRRRRGLLLVTEMFLPSIAALPHRHAGTE